jgi:hypothetical protein
MALKRRGDKLFPPFPNDSGCIIIIIIIVLSGTWSGPQVGLIQTK